MNELVEASEGAMVVKAALLGANSRILSDTRNEQEKY